MRKAIHIFKFMVSKQYRTEYREDIRKKRKFAEIMRVNNSILIGKG